MGYPYLDREDEYEAWLGSQAEREADAYYEAYQNYCDDQEAKFYDRLMREEYEAEMEAEASWADLLARVERGEYDEHFDDDAP